VTSKYDLVWEYISPFWGTLRPINQVYRAYRVPYEWVPQLEKPEEKHIERIDVSEWSLNGASPKNVLRTIKMEGVRPYNPGSPLCVTQADDD
jgi:hypothetical protein